ncbi:MAG: thioredoxin domain-containing protein [Bacillota bacterium]
MTQEFHFSPRPNRAHEIQWRNWGQEPFQEAQEQGKLVILDISGVWCHWCHVMDETSYSDPEIIKLINEQFIPIRVDTDQRPDVNNRYNLGGWPTTAILSDQGELLTGGTYLPPGQLKSLLLRLSSLDDAEKETIREHIKSLSDEDGEETTGEKENFSWDLYHQGLDEVRQAYDPVYGGFGNQPKFPMVGALELALDGWITEHDAILLKIVSHSLHAMADGGMYDPVEGGFFRYSTTRDWTVPHFEKMLEDNAGLLDCLMRVYQITGDEYFNEIAQSVLGFLQNSLYQADTGTWSGTQDADEDYYNEDAQGRKNKQAPYIDKNIYINWNALLSRSLFTAAWVTGNQHWEYLALNTLGFLLRRCYNDERGMAHYHDGSQPRLWGWLDDQVMSGHAFNAAYQSTGENLWLDSSEKLARFCMGWLQAPGGGFFDILPDPTAPGAMSRPHVDPAVNARAARWLLELAALTGNDEYRATAHQVLQEINHYSASSGVMASGLALAVADALRPWSVLTVVGPAEEKQTATLKQAALSTVAPAKVVRFLDSNRQRAAVEEAGYFADGRCRVHACRGTVCYPPIETKEELLDLFIQMESKAGFPSHLTENNEPGEAKAPDRRI